ncbi:dihydroneopterin aldolase [Chloroflexota bacterium]
MDKVLIKDLHVKGIIGIHEWEREAEQDILINIECFTNTKEASISDDIKDCIDYEDLTKKVISMVRLSSRHTLEALAEDIAKLCLSNQNVQNVKVRVEKPGVLKDVSSVGIQIER